MFGLTTSYKAKQPEYVRTFGGYQKSDLPTLYPEMALSYYYIICNTLCNIIDGSRKYKLDAGSIDTLDCYYKELRTAYQLLIRRKDFSTVPEPRFILFNSLYAYITDKEVWDKVKDSAKDDLEKISASVRKRYVMPLDLKNCIEKVNRIFRAASKDTYRIGDLEFDFVKGKIVTPDKTYEIDSGIQIFNFLKLLFERRDEPVTYLYIARELSLGCYNGNAQNDDVAESVQGIRKDLIDRLVEFGLPCKYIKLIKSRIKSHNSTEGRGYRLS